VVTDLYQLFVQIFSRRERRARRVLIINSLILCVLCALCVKYFIKHG